MQVKYFGTYFLHYANQNYSNQSYANRGPPVFKDFQRNFREYF